jgi:7-carboxy-7-deazaguanine synthase
MNKQDIDEMNGQVTAAPILRVTEIFYSLQGEGARAGTPTIFIRLSGCKTKHACAASGIKCDTEFESGADYTLPELEDWIKDYAPLCREITWTGGEPLDQITAEVTTYFKKAGYFQAVETSGLQPIPPEVCFDFICVSPKVAEHIIAKNFIHVSELRYVRHHGQNVPLPSISADHYWLSPHSDGNQLNQQNLQHCIELCKQNPKWKLSIQQHKIWKVL